MWRKKKLILRSKAERILDLGSLGSKFQLGTLTMDDLILQNCHFLSLQNAGNILLIIYMVVIVTKCVTKYEVLTTE